MPNLADLLVDSARRAPDAPALRHDEDVWSYGRLDDASARFAGHLRSAGIGPGERVVVSLPNVPAFAVAYYGALRAGCVVVPMNPLFKPREVTYYVADSGARLVVGVAPDTATGTETAGAAFLDATALPGILADTPPLAEVVDRADDEVAVLLYTSGTTGRPKGAELTHANLRVNQEICARTLMRLTPDDVVMGCLPLFHVFGMTCALNVAIAAGATLTLLPRFEPARALEMLSRDEVTVFEGVPTMYGALLAAADAAGGEIDLPALRTCISGGSSMPVELMRRFEDRFGCVVLEGYGLSETSPVASFNRPDIERRPGTIGVPIEGVEMKLVDADGADVPPGGVGEIVIRGHNIMRGYWNRPEETAAAVRDGWFHSGDLGRVDEDGYFSIVDRAKDLIVRGGFNVYPREVEEVLYEHPAVAEAAVVGVPDERLGEEVAAYVVLRGPVDPAGLTAFVKERVAPYKYPRHIHVVDGLPKGATGKILKRELRRT